jgi:hypothetical protein
VWESHIGTPTSLAPSNQAAANRTPTSHCGDPSTDACARAASVDGSPQWLDGVRMAAAWFDGANDVGVPMWDSHTSGGYDGLMAHGVNLNQGAESTLALLSTFQQAERLHPVGV